MKKILVLPITLLLIVILSACTETSGVPIEPNTENMIINIKNDANFEIYGVEVNILKSSPSGVNADGSKIKKGESLTFEFSEDDFKLDGQTTMKVSILNRNDEVLPTNEELSIELGNNKELFFEITGDSINEADIREVN